MIPSTLTPRCSPVGALARVAAPQKPFAVHCSTSLRYSTVGLQTQLPRTAHQFHALPQRAARPARGTTVQTFSRKGGSDDIDVADRVVASLPYLLPLFDSLRYGRYVFMQFPAFTAVLLPFDPLIKFYFGIPFAGLVVFFAVYLGIVNNQSFSRYVRFNAMQAVLLDILLVLPGVLESVFRRPTDGALLQLYINGYNTIFLFCFVCFSYGVGSCLLGQTPRLPLVADAADRQVM